MTRRLVRTSFGATLLASLALGMYGAGGWVAAQIAPSDTGPSAREAAATLAAEAAEDAKLPRANGQSGGFEVTSDSAKYNVDLYFPCEPGYNTEFDPRPYRDSELNFANDGVAYQVVCADGTVKSVYGGGAYRSYFIQDRPFAYADAPAERLQAETIEAFANELLVLTKAGNFGGVVDRAVAAEVTCPTVEGLPGNVCEGQAAGARVEAYTGGLLFGGAEFYGRRAFEAFVAERVAALGPGGLTLYTIASGGHITNARECDGCATAVVSTPANAAIPGGVATVLLFEFEPVGEALRVTAVLGGTVDELARPAIEGGQYGRLRFERVGGAASPTPPAVGLGAPGADSPSKLPIAAVALLAAGLLMAGAARVWSRRRIES